MPDRKTAKNFTGIRRALKDFINFGDHLAKIQSEALLKHPDFLHKESIFAISKINKEVLLPACKFHMGWVSRSLSAKETCDI